MSLGVVAALGVTGCGADETQVEGPEPSAPPTESSEPADPLYAIVTEVYAADTTTSYVVLMPALDQPTIGLEGGLEVPNVSRIAASEGRLYVSNREDVTLTRFDVSDGTFRENGRVSFAAYAVPDPGSHAFISSDKAYLFDWNTGDHVVWNPASMEIQGVIDAPVAGEGSLDTSAAVVRDGVLQRTFSWFDWSQYRTLDRQYLATYDTRTDELVSLVEEERCVGLTGNNGPDEAGRVYFSNSVYSVTETLVRGARPSCALRLRDEGFDTGWRLMFAEAAGGRQAAALDYLGNGKALITVFHHERVSLDPQQDPEELVWSTNWRLWHLDVETAQAHVIDQIGWIAGGYTTVRVDGEALVLVATEDYASTQAYAITDDGNAELRFSIPGYSSQVVRVR